MNIEETKGKGLTLFGQDEDVRLYDPDVDCIPIQYRNEVN